MGAMHGSQEIDEQNFISCVTFVDETEQHYILYRCR